MMKMHILKSLYLRKRVRPVLLPQLRHAVAAHHHTNVATNKTVAFHTSARSCQQWEFPLPFPAPSQQELRLNGIPLLNQALQHAYHGRILLSGWRNENNGSVDIASYMDVLLQARHVAKFLSQQHDGRQEPKPKGDTTDGPPSNSNSTPRPKLAAHLNVPGWEYVATQWGIWGSGLGSVPLALTQKTPEMEHVLTDSDPQIIFAGGDCQLDANNSSATTHIPGNTNDLIQAAKNVGMEDRIVHLKDLFQPRLLSKEDPSSTNTPDSEFWLGRSGIVPSLDEPALILYTSGTTGKVRTVSSSVIMNSLP
jgi:hypothetical protein